jgi:protein-ribulosamine 3-kinase
MMRGEFESSKAINTVISGFALGPAAWGTFKSDPDLHFFLQHFHEMDPELLDREKLASKLVEMHRKSSEMHL